MKIFRIWCLIAGHDWVRRRMDDVEVLWCRRCHTTTPAPEPGSFRAM